jgi:hypothetical protein
MGQESSPDNLLSSPETVFGSRSPTFERCDKNIFKYIAAVLMEYAMQESRLSTACAKNDISELKALLDSSYLRIKSLSCCKLYALGGCEIGALVDRIRLYRADDGLVDVISCALERKQHSDIYRLLSPDLWEDFVVFLEQFCRTLRNGEFLSSMKINCLRTLQVAKKAVKEEERRAITEYLLLYCEFKINRRPGERRKLALSAAAARPSIPYPDEHRELLEHLADIGVDIARYGYDPEIHGDICVKKPEKDQIVELVERNCGLQEILSVDSGLVELLHMGYTIDFGEETYFK